MTGDGEGQGHYICDVKLRNSSTWFKTNDNCIPVQILPQDVTKSGVVILLRRTD